MIFWIWLLCSWMTFSYSRVLFSNWNWLVCSSSALNVMRIWGCEKLSVSSKLVCGMAWQNTLIYQSPCCSEVSFKAFVIQKITNYLTFETLKFCPFFCYSGSWGFACLIFLFWGKREMELEYLLMVMVLCFLYSILSLYKQEIFLRYT